MAIRRTTYLLAASCGFQSSGNIISLNSTKVIPATDRRHNFSLKQLFWPLNKLPQHATLSSSQAHLSITKRLSNNKLIIEVLAPTLSLTLSPKPSALMISIG